MSRLLAISVFFTLIFTISAQGAPVVATKPALSCPQADLGNADQQARYEMMWQKYSESIEEVSRKLQGELATQTRSATEAGNLDLVLFWKSLADGFDKKGELQWDDATLKKTWNDRFGDSSYPSQFVVSLKKASEAFASATRELEKGYGELVSELTRAEKLNEALKIRAELRDLLAEKAPASKPEPAPKPKSVPERTTIVTHLSSLPATAKRLQNGWFEIGTVWNQPIIQGNRRGDNSIFLHAKPDSFTSVSYQLPTGQDLFESGVVVPKVKGEQGNPATPLVFEVWGDGRILWRSQPVAVMNQMQDCRVGIKGVRTLELRVVCPGRDNWGVAVWFEPRLVGSR
jgi:hypothetical protein